MSSTVVTNSHRICAEINSYSNLPGVFDVCLEVPRHSKLKFVFVVDEFSELKHTIQSIKGQVLALQGSIAF